MWAVRVFDSSGRLLNHTIIPDWPGEITTQVIEIKDAPPEPTDG